MRIRDPRESPQVGDILTGVGNVRIRVTQVDDGIVTFTFDALSELGDDYRPIEAWRRWARTAAIIHRSEEGKEEG